MYIWTVGCFRCCLSTAAAAACLSTYSVPVSDAVLSTVSIINYRVPIKLQTVEKPITLKPARPNDGYVSL